MEIKVYTADVRQLEDTELFSQVYSHVSAGRRKKTDRMRFGKDRRLSLGAGALLEAALAKEGVKDMALTSGENNKPHLLNGCGIEFNISHSGTRVMCVLSDCDIGCDVEQITDIDMDIARRFYHAEEYRALMNCCSLEERTDLFFRYWTLKESFMKATGLGLQIPTDEILITFGVSGISIQQNVDRRNYLFKEFFFHDGYRYAICSVGKPADKVSVCEIRSFWSCI